MNLLSKFATCVSDGVDGKGSTDGGVEMNDLYGGARISYIFNEVRTCARLRSIPSSASSPPKPHFSHPLLFYTHSNMECCTPLYSYFVNALVDTSYLSTYTDTHIYTPHTPNTQHTTYIPRICYTVGVWPYDAITGPIRRT